MNQYIILDWKLGQYSLKEFLVELYKVNNLDTNSFMNPKFDTFERILFPSFMDMPKIYRDDAVDCFWKHASSLGNRKEIYFIQGSPGCGKTFTLRDIGHVPQQQEKYSHYLCVGISFNFGDRN